MIFKFRFWSSIVAQKDSHQGFHNSHQGLQIPKKKLKATIGLAIRIAKNACIYNFYIAMRGLLMRFKKAIQAWQTSCNHFSWCPVFSVSYWWFCSTPVSLHFSVPLYRFQYSNTFHWSCDQSTSLSGQCIAPIAIVVVPWKTTIQKRTDYKTSLLKKLITMINFAMLSEEVNPYCCFNQSI